MIAKYVRLRERNQITLPSEILEGLSVSPGDFLEISRAKDNSIRLRATELVIVNTEMSDREEDLALAAEPSGAERIANTAKVERILKGERTGEAPQAEEEHGSVQAAIERLVENEKEMVVKAVSTRANANTPSRAAASHKQSAAAGTASVDP